MLLRRRLRVRIEGRTDGDRTLRRILRPDETARTAESFAALLTRTMSTSSWTLRAGRCAGISSPSKPSGCSRVWTGWGRATGTRSRTACAWSATRDGRADGQPIH